MTREKAIEIIRKHECNAEHYEACEMAIQALEQEPKSEWQYDHDILKAYSDGANEVLDKIRTEITDTLYVDSLIFGELIDFKNGKISADDVIEEFNRVTRMEVLQIIDKYKTEWSNGQ